MDIFHISRVLRSGSRHSWVNIYSGEWKLQQTISVFPFAPIARENPKWHFYKLPKQEGNTERLIMLARREKNITFSITPSVVVLETLMQQG